MPAIRWTTTHTVVLIKPSSPPFSRLRDNSHFWPASASPPNFCYPSLGPSAENAKSRRLDLAWGGDAFVGLAHALVAADFSILPLALLHEGLELGVVALRDRLGLHLDGELTTGALDARADVDDGLLKPRDAHCLFQALAGEDVQGRRHQPDLDLVLFGVASLGAPVKKTSCQYGGQMCVVYPGALPQGGLDGVDALVAEARHLDVGSELRRLGCQPL